MNIPGTSYEFNPQIDAEYLETLFGDDTGTLKEVFASFLADTKEGFEEAKQAFYQGNLAEFRQKIHKIKPTFGYAGLPQLTENCQQVIAACDKAASTDEVKPACEELFSQIENSFEIIQGDLKKIEEAGF